MTPQFEIKDLHSGYRDVFTMQLPELIIRSRRLNVLTGPNGCGKSTLLNILAFLKKPERGELSFAGNVVRWRRAELKALRRRVTLLHQSPYLFGGTVTENVEYGLRIRGCSGDRLRDAVNNVLALVSLGGFNRRDVRQLSGGEIRRVALARALALDPEVLLLDEPLANLDQHSAAIVERVVAALPELGTTVIMATHDLKITERFDCDLIRLANGQLDRSPEMQVCPPLMMPAF
jgi:tungstate transport system ATP-binding protein